MTEVDKKRNLLAREAPLEMSAEEFRSAGHRTVDRIADFLTNLREGPVTAGEVPSVVRASLPPGSVPADGMPAEKLLEATVDLLIRHSLFNGHPRFFGYITSSAAPIGALGDLLAAIFNPNVGGWNLSPIASEIEAQTVRWIAELIGFPADCGGILVSGGNMANFVAFLAARKARATWDIRAQGLAGHPGFTLYVSSETHTWIQKAADLFGFGTDAIRWIPVDSQRRMEVAALEREVARDRKKGSVPLLVVGSAGTVAFGAIDPLAKIASFCRREALWFHVDGAYGAPAAMLPEAAPDLKALSEADSVAIDPHKWLYAPLEAGCTLVRDRRHLPEAFSFHPEYYAFAGEEEELRTNFHEWGPQNSRGFRALKVWLALRQVGREGYVRMIRDDIDLAEALFAACRSEPEIEAVTRNLSIATFRFVPPDLAGRADAEDYLNELNRELLETLQAGGEAFVSNAVLDGRFLLRACIVNFRTSLADVQALPEIVVRAGRKVDADRRTEKMGRPGEAPVRRSSGK
ncbi:MAG TPA: aspartate aminotransferase family protein [Thermoanaerobaculia bacterium]|nr:aspartate aminotransferase family protein [Thermoanaerobaculia bacterium]